MLARSRKVGANVYQLRAEFVVALMEASRVLNITFIPGSLATPFPEDLARAAAGGSATGTTAAPQEAAASTDAAEIELKPEVSAALKDLMPSPTLAAMAGYA